MTTTRDRAAIYVRISEDRTGAGLGVERQEKECRALSERMGWDVTEVYTDNDISASSFTKKRRPNYLAMLTAIEARKIDVVIAWHTDRLHRSPAELEHYINVCSAVGRDVPTHCVTAGILDLSNSNGRMMARIAGSVAAHESEHKSERIKLRFSADRAAGKWYVGARPFGYTHDGAIVPDEAKVIVDGVQRVLRGESLRSIAMLWQTSGVERVSDGRSRPDSVWVGATIASILSNPRHAGLVTHRPYRRGPREILGKGDWEAILTEDEHYAVVAKLRKKRDRYSNNQQRRGAYSLQWLGSGLYHCACGATMRPGGSAPRSSGRGSPPRSGERSNTRNREAIYRCRDAMVGASSGPGHVTIGAKAVDEHVRTTASRMIVKRGLTLLPRRPDDTAEQIAALYAAEAAAQILLDELDAERGDGKISTERWAKMTAPAEERRDAAIAAREALTEGSLFEWVADAPDPDAAFRALPVDRQRQLVDELMTITIKPVTQEPVSALSKRQAEVLTLIAEDPTLTNTEIAARLSIGVRTVESHVCTLLRRLGASPGRGRGRPVDRRAFVALAEQAGGWVDYYARGVDLDRVTIVEREDWPTD